MKLPLTLSLGAALAVGAVFSSALVSSELGVGRLR